MQFVHTLIPDANKVWWWSIVELIDVDAWNKKLSDALRGSNASLCKI